MAEVIGHSGMFRHARQMVSYLRAPCWPSCFFLPCLDTHVDMGCHCLLPLLQVGTSDKIVVGASSQAGGAAMLPASLTKLLSHMSAAVIVDTSNWSLCGANGLQLSSAGKLGQPGS